jgi:hypothetical protein
MGAGLSMTLSDLASSGCDLAKLRDVGDSELTKILNVLGFDEQQRSVLTRKVTAMPAGLSREQLVTWAAQQEGSAATPPLNRSLLCGELSDPLSVPVGSGVLRLDT